MAAPMRNVLRMLSYQKSLFTPYAAVSPQLDYNVRHFHGSSVYLLPRRGGIRREVPENGENFMEEFEGEGGNPAYDMFPDGRRPFPYDREIDTSREGKRQKRFNSLMDSRKPSDDTPTYPIENDFQALDKLRKKRRKPNVETFDEYEQRAGQTEVTEDNAQVSYDEPGEKWWKYREFEKVQPGNEEHLRFETRIEQLAKEQKAQRNAQKKEEEKHETAKDIADRLREEQWAEEIAIGRGLKDIGDLNLSKEKFLYKWKHQVPDLSHVSPHTLAGILKKTLLYDEGDIVAIEKPYGVPVHGGPGMGISIADALPVLRQALKTERLYLVHRLDKETTGVMLLAKSEDMARQLHNLFRLRKVIKRYWVLSMGIPPHEEGIIDIPIKETEITAQGRPHYRMVCVPEYSEETKLFVRKKRQSTDAQVAITNFRVLDSYGSCALVECQPETGVKHQIRSHMAYALGCPILGDHKYSNYNKLAPQQLPAGMLEKLGIQQPKARYLPMHLHARQVILPDFRDGRNLYFTARLPHFFTRNMKKLKVKVPKKLK